MLTNWIKLSSTVSNMRQCIVAKQNDRLVLLKAMARLQNSHYSHI